MSLNTKRLLFILITCFSVAALSAQTLYWVGGSGNFNDPKHWSLNRTGEGSNILPDENSTLVFYDSSIPQSSSYQVKVTGNFSVKSILIKSENTAVIFKSGDGPSKLTVSGNFINSSNLFQSNVSFEFKKGLNKMESSVINTGNSKLNTDLTVSGGNWIISNVKLANSRAFTLLGTTVEFRGSVIETDKFIIRDAPLLYFNKAYIKAFKSVEFIGNNDVKIEKSYLNNEPLSSSYFDENSTAGGSKKYGSGQVNSSCIATPLVIKPSCSPGCDGKIIFTLPSFSCYAPAIVTAYNIDIPSTGTCAALSSLVNVGPGTYTISNVCSCSSAYNIVVKDQNGIFIDVESASVTEPSINSLNLTPTKTISCFGVCNGSVNLAFFGGTGPYTYTIIPPTGATYTSSSAGGLALTSLCAGNLSITAVDVNQCKGSYSFLFTTPTAIIGNEIANNVTCKNACNATFLISPTQGSPNYTVSYSNGFSVTTTPSVQVSSGSLCPGPITATITDSKGCTITRTASITEPGDFTVTPTQTNVACNGNITGAAMVMVSGGTPTYAFGWSPASGSTSVITGLGAGTQTVTITDQNACTTTVGFNITQPPAITLTPTQTNVVCSGASTGAASINPSGGTGTFHYTWTAPGPPALSGDVAFQTNLSSFASPYTVTVVDGNNCTSPPVLITITQPPAVTLAITNKSVSCFGLSDGGATVTASGGNNASYTYTWTPGGFNTAGISGLNANTYSLTVRDASACATQTTVTIIQPTQGVIPNVTSMSLSCNVANSPCNGTVGTSPTGGTPPYSYTLTNGVTTNTNGPSYTNLCAGNYTVIVKDASGCPQQSVVTLNQPNALVPNIAKTDVSCFGANTAGLTGSGSGGTPSYTLTWVTPTGTSSGAILNSQPAGNYTLYVVDSHSCMAQTTATVTQPSSITIAVGSSSISCFSVCNGVLTSTVSGGTGGYNYAWTNSLNVNVGSAPTATGLCPGPYTLTITDANLCVKTATGVVLSPSQMSLTASSTPVNCFGDSNGSATVTASGGTPGYVFNFASPSSTVINSSGIISAQPSGTFLATVTDNATPGCVQTITFAITTPTALTAAISGTGSCNACNGTATVSPSFGTPPYSYSWTTSPATTSNVAALCPMNYTATVTDSKGCVVTRTIGIQQIVTLTVTPNASGILCNGGNTGSATVTPSGGTPAYTYSWSVAGQTAASISSLTAGGYTVTVTDNSSPVACTQTAAITITQPPAITVTATQTNVTCFGFTNGVLSATATGGTGTKSYTWSPGSSNSSSISSIAAGVYTLLVRDANLCPSTTLYTVTQSPSITITHTTVNPTSCVPPYNGSICVTASGGSGSGYTYNWAPTSGTNSCISGLSGGSYQHTVTDGAGCTNTISVTLFNATGPTLTAVSSSVSCYGGSTGTGSVSAAGVGPFTFTWSPAVPNTTTSSSSSATGLLSNNYAITCSDINGCVTNTNIVIAQAPSVTVNSTVTAARCNALCNGSITVVPTQGTLTGTTYTYNWLPVTPTIAGQGTGTVSSLCANIYSLTLTNSPNCVTQHTFSVTQPSLIAITATVNNLLCNNVCTGSIIANATGGTGAINYSWTPVSGGSATITNLCATGGTNAPSYTLTVTDQQSCTATQTFAITQPPLLSNNVNTVSATCSNSCNATATQVATGGVSSYSYSWSSSTVTTSSIGGLCGGTYTAFVTDGNGCTSSKAYTITPPAPLSLSLTPANPLCNAACNGSISTSVSGAQGSVTYFWSPAGSGQNPTGLCATPNPIYTVVATDQNSCKVTAIATLTNPPAITATVSATNPLCNGNSNGTASVTLSNAIGAVNYTWQPTGPPTKTTQAVTGLSAGAYTVSVKDANNCQGSQTFTLTNPPALVVNAAVNPASCGQPNGDITANPSGGTPGSPTAYTYTWIGTVSSASFVSGLSAGVYTVLVSDGANCTTTLGISLNNSSGPTSMPVVSSSIICNSQCTGAASVDISGIVGGTPGYTVTWLPPATSGTNEITGLCAGLYNAQVLDATGCIGFTNVTIAEPPPISNTTNINFPLCAGVCDGAFSVTTSGGNSPYTYSWMPLGSTSATVTNLCAGDYTLVVGYNGVCTDTSRINLPDQTTITIVPSVTNNVCFGTSTGIASLSINGGASPYVAGWNTGQTGLSLNNLANGTYSVIVTDNNGCSNTATTAITSGAQITSSTTIVSPSCGLCNGSATVAATGSGPFSFNWSNSSTTPGVSNLCAGVYQVVITDALSCSQTETVIINNSNGITGENINTQQIPCSGACVGAATVSAIGGTSPISYNWINPVNTSSVISNLCPGTYFVQMTDFAGCIRTASVNIDPLVTLTVSPFVFLPSCGASDGSISIAIAGGTPSYNIVWNPPAGLTTSLTGLNSGVYSYTVIESGPNSCSVSNAINLSNSMGPIIEATQRNVDCFGMCTGSVSTIVTTTNSPVSYLWSVGAASSSSITNLCKGVVTLTVTDALLCKTIETFTITDNPLLQLGLANVQNSKCFGDCNGSINLVPNGGSLPYTYSWTSVSSTVNPVTSLCDGVYSASVIDSKGCVVTSPTYSIRSRSSMSLTANTSSSSCSSVSDASITIVASGGIQEYSYNWQGPSSFTAATQNISNVYSGSYTVVVSDSLGCLKDTVLMISPSITIVANAGPDQIICPETGSVSLKVAGSSANTTYQWYYLNNTTNVLANGPELIVNNLREPTSYLLKSISPIPACYAEDTIIVNVHILPAIDAGRDVTIPVHSTVTIGGYPTNWGAATLTWSPAAYLSDANASNPVASNTVNTTFVLTATDANGCISTDSIHVFLYPELNITSGFTPNGDGKNDFWIIDYIEQFPATTVDIFNRWGDVVYSSRNGYNVPFDGKYKGTDLPVGTYYYVIKLNHPGYPKPITGPLTIFR